VENIVLIGSSGHARVIIDIIERQGRYRIAGLIDSFRAIGEMTFDYAVLGAETDLPALSAAHHLQGCLVAIGDNFVRERVVRTVRNLLPQLPFVTAIHPAAIIGRDSVIGPGTVVMAGAIINPAARIGESCIVNTRASLDHDCLMEAFSSLAPGVTTGGGCRIGSGAAVGIGATLRHGINIGNHSLIGAGAVVLDDVAANSIVYGVPARKVRDRQPGEQYL
jgi:sugar O-acyltransferase (sialic acid O-acetyltransferase NeuD family)